MAHIKEHPEVANPWRDIGEAPKDGTHILVYAVYPNRDAVVVEAFYFDAEDGDPGFWQEVIDGSEVKPTHFMLLPKPITDKE